MNLEIRPIEDADPAFISAAFTELGWDKPVEQYERYIAEQNAGSRHVFVATVEGSFAGYATVIWESVYKPFRQTGIPEIQDFNVLPKFRRKGIGTALMDRAEEFVAERSEVIGIGVGMFADYGNAQRMYAKRGYVPDGRGVTYKGEVLKYGDNAINDDDLVLYFVKELT